MASMKKAKPSKARGKPMIAPENFVKVGQSRPISNERIVPETAPITKSNAKAFVQRRDNRPSSLGRFRGQAPCLSATTVQRTQARHTLQLAQAVLLQGGIAPGRLETQVREGVPFRGTGEGGSRTTGGLHRPGTSRLFAPIPPQTAPAGKYHCAGSAQGSLPGSAGACALGSHRPGHLV